MQQLLYVFKKITKFAPANAKVAQLVEHNLAKVRVGFESRLSLLSPL